MDALWAALASNKAAEAHRALWQMVRGPASSVALLREQLSMVEPVSRARLAALVADLDADDFAVRERASGELEKLGELALPTLRQAKAGGKSLEVKRRAGEVLERLQPKGPSGAQLRQGRALSVLEQVATPEARQLLERLARGAEEATLTREARAALQRLAGRPGAR